MLIALIPSSTSTQLCSRPVVTSVALRSSSAVGDTPGVSTVTTARHISRSVRGLILEELVENLRVPVVVGNTVGYTATKEIMARSPVPVVITSGQDVREGSLISFSALAAGANR